MTRSSTQNIYIRLVMPYLYLLLKYTVSIPKLEGLIFCHPLYGKNKKFNSYYGLII